MHGRRCWEVEMKMQEKGVWKSTKRKKERLKCAFIKVKSPRTVWKEDESRCEWKQEVILEGGEYGEWREGGEFQQNKGWKWEVGTGRG